jgi:hypothetical protein
VLKLDVNISYALPPKDVSDLADPLVGHPLGPEQDGASSVKHGHVGLAAPPEIVPEDGRASDRRNGDAEARKGSPAPSGDVREVDHEGRHAVAGQVGLAVDGFEAVGLKLELC